MSRILYTSCKNNLLLNRSDERAPGWILGYGDFDLKRGKTAAEIMGMNGKVDESKALVAFEPTEDETTDAINETSEEEGVAIEKKFLNIES